MIAEHVIGLHPNEYICPAEHGEPVRLRFEQIRQSGVLVPAEHARQSTSNSFEIDVLAGDNRYVFLSAGPRYRLNRPASVCFGFLFDAEDLIRNHGALVAPDMAPAYEELLDDIVREVDAQLPPLEPISDDELAEFADRMGITDPAMLAHLRTESTSRYHGIIDAVLSGDFSLEGASQASALFTTRVGKLQSKMRKSGEEAVAALCEGMEILVPNRLPLSLAIGKIEVGKCTHF